MTLLLMNEHVPTPIYHRLLQIHTLFITNMDFSVSRDEIHVRNPLKFLCFNQSLRSLDLTSIGAEKVPRGPGRRGKLSLTRGNFIIHDKDAGIFS